MPASFSRRLLAPAAALTFALTVTSAHAAPQTVVGGNLNWSTAKLWNPTATVPVTDRTFVGYGTRNTSFGHQNWTMSPVGAAWGTTVDPASPQGFLATWNFPAVNGIYDPETDIGTVSTIGRMQAVSVNVSNLIGFNYTLSIENPTIVFDGTSTARLYASGTKYDGTYDAPPAENSVAYDRVELFTLDLSQVVETQSPDGTTTLSNLVPTVVTDIYGGFPPGAGPDRTPNTFGGFSLSFRAVDGQVGPKGDTGETGPAGPEGPAGPAGETGQTGPVGSQGPAGVAGNDGATGKTGATGKDGATGKTGAAGKDGAPGKTGATGKTGKTGSTKVIARLAKAPFKGSKTRKVSLRKGTSVVATGTVKKRTLTVTVAKGKKVSAGKYTLKLNGSKSTKSIRIG